MPITGLNQTTWGDTFNPVIKNAAEMKAVNSVDITLSNYTQRLFPPGIFAGTNGTGFRLLPRTRYKTNPTTTTITVSPFTAGLFFVGDVINQITLTDGSAGTAVGTVSAINHSTNTITLTAAIGTVPAVDTVIGVAASRPIKTDGTKLGLLSPNTAINLDDTGRFPTVANSHFSCISSGSFYRGLMPHLDTELERLFPEMSFS
jgi:hypothetical protein